MCVLSPEVRNKAHSPSVAYYIVKILLRYVPTDMNNLQMTYNYQKKRNQAHSCLVVDDIQNGPEHANPEVLCLPI